MSEHIYIIAEAGVNHDGSLDKALALVSVAADAGADAVKFQTFSADRLATAAAPKADYQKTTTNRTESQHAMLRRLELSAEDHKALIARCAARGIAFLSTPFDIQSLSLLVDDLRLQQIKLGSGELTNGPLLLAAARTALPIILSTGMGTLDEVAAALGVLAFGYSGRAAPPSTAHFEAALADPALRAILAQKVILLHCTTEYPAPLEDVNLRAMETLGKAFGIPVGYSDHTRGFTISLAAAARGAVVIEKHFTLDRTAEGPDHAASIEPQELAEMVKAIRDIQVALGDGAKGPRASECGNIAVARKSIVAARPISAGEMLSGANLAVKRSGGGISPMRWWEVEGQSAKRAFAQDEAIEF